MKTVKTTASARYYKKPTVITVADHIANKMLANGSAVEVTEGEVETPEVPAAKPTENKETKTITKNKVKK